MALPFCQVQFPAAVSLPTTTAPKAPPTISASNFSKILSHPRRRSTLFIAKSAKEEGDSATSTDEAAPNAPAEEGSSQTKLGIEKEEIKRSVKEDTGLLSGVAEEIGEIEWPGFGKVLGTTGVVLGVIAGSSVVLLTVNAVFAEISDKVFAGKGIQDFFG